MKYLYQSNIYLIFLVTLTCLILQMEKIDLESNLPKRKATWLDSGGSRSLPARGLDCQAMGLGSLDTESPLGTVCLELRHCSLPPPSNSSFLEVYRKGEKAVVCHLVSRCLLLEPSSACRKAAHFKKQVQSAALCNPFGTWAGAQEQ